jgi:Xaa-Pro aminopeptidase
MSQTGKVLGIVLVDLSCEYNYYRTDIARTVPVSGKFTKEQRALYELYLIAYRAARSVRCFYGSARKKPLVSLGRARPGAAL